MPAVWVKGKMKDDGTSVTTPTKDPRGPWAAYSCMILYSYDETGTNIVPGGPCNINCKNVEGGYNAGTIYAFHTGGANVQMMDGSVRFLREGIAFNTLFALISRAGGEVISGDY